MGTYSFLWPEIGAAFADIDNVPFVVVFHGSSWPFHGRHGCGCGCGASGVRTMGNPRVLLCAIFGMSLYSCGLGATRECWGGVDAK